MQTARHRTSVLHRWRLPLPAGLQTCPQPDTRSSRLRSAHEANGVRSGQQTHHRPPGTRAASNPHSQRPPQTPAASFKSPYRKRLGSKLASSPRLPCAEAFPMKASDDTSTWIASGSRSTRERALTSHDRALSPSNSVETASLPSAIPQHVRRRTQTSRRAAARM